MLFRSLSAQIYCTHVNIFWHFWGTDKLPTKKNLEMTLIVTDQCSKRALVFELVAPPLEQIFSGSKHLGMVPGDPYRCTLCAKIFLFLFGCNGNPPTHPSDYRLRPSGKPENGGHHYQCRGTLKSMLLSITIPWIVRKILVDICQW